MMSSDVRVRFAPSPTGALHIGGVRTALYNYLYAKNQGGKFIVRIEDTDQKRYVPGAEEYIMNALSWLGISVDESPAHGGEYGPYRQSERKEKGMYKEYAMKLVEEGNAYYAFDTSDELEAMRERLKAARVASPQYNALTRTSMKNSLTLSEDEVKERLDSGEPYVIRLKVPRKEEVRLNDAVRGWVMVHSSAIDDKVILKSDGMPTYHLANVVDDHLMKITHVIRGEEWLPSAPLHVLLYKYLGWEDTMPQFAHLPLILNPNGEGKLSKRHADKYGFPVFPLDWDFKNEAGEMVTSKGFKESDYLPEALLNFLAFLGWNPGNEQEIFSMEGLGEAFSLKRVGKAGTKFDIDKLKWFNQYYLREKTGDELAIHLSAQLQDKAVSFEKEKLPEVCEMMKERVTFIHELYSEALYFFQAPTSYDEKVVSKKWNEQVVDGLSAFLEVIPNITDFEAANVKQALFDVLNEKGIKMGKIMQPLRVAISGVAGGPDLMSIIAFLGKEEVISRIKNAIANIPV